MKISELKKIAAEFIKGKNPKNAKGCYVAPDGSVFYRDYSGLQYARAQAGNPQEVCEFDEKGDLVKHKDADAERADLLVKISQDPTSKYQVAQLANLSNESLRNLTADLTAPSTTTDAKAPQNSDDGDTIDLDRMKHADLVALLLDIDPTHVIEKETKGQLKDLIVASNSLTDHDDAKLISMIKAFDPELITEDTTDEDVVKVLSNDDLKAIVLNVRDGVEVDQDITDKLFTLDSPDGSEDTQEDSDTDENN